MAKQKEGTDILALAEKLTGIHYIEIMQTAYAGSKLTLNERDERIYIYEDKGIIQMRVRLFSAMLVLDWKKKHGDFTILEKQSED